MARPNWWQRAKNRLKRALGINIFLCDSCKWNWPTACRNPERPNATYCREHTKK